ncbi:MAG: UDP-N-acetylmuramoyl-tripeptide--D-alanyl-D-alanine ligase, partial [bacterium]|nr:UDP-N-acetylmuramoyl-tripeptide--D-alanyl-D-alanine ligase [bacterium]
MLNISVEEILNATEGKLVQGSQAVINRFSLDTRTLQKKDFFIAVKGPNFDGHDYVVESFRKGANGALVDITKLGKVKSDFKKHGYKDIPASFIIIKVEDTLRSYGLIAAFYRRRFNPVVIAVTGSNGKTTTKELIYQLLLTRYRENEVLKTEKNYNNEIGVPQTIFQLTPRIKVLVVELGINHIGEMQRLGYMTEPDAGVITNIGETHLEFLKNDKIVAKAKGELMPYIKETLVVNFDDKYYNYFLNNSESRVLGFTLNSDLDMDKVNRFDSYMNLGLDGFEVVYKGEKMKFGLIGEHNLYNLLAALTVCDSFKLDKKKIRKVIEKFKPLEDRGNIMKCREGFVYFDAYNANPTSVKAMLYFIHNLKFGNKIAVLGDMMELGKKAMKHHTEVLNYANELDFSRICV